MDPLHILLAILAVLAVGRFVLAPLWARREDRWDDEQYVRGDYGNPSKHRNGYRRV